MEITRHALAVQLYAQYAHTERRHIDKAIGIIPVVGEAAGIDHKVFSFYHMFLSFQYFILLIIDDSEKDIYVLARIAPSEDDSREWLQQNDAIIVEGQDLYDGKTVYY